MSMSNCPPAGALVPRHRPGRGSGVTPAERREIQLAALVECSTQQELADRFGRTRDTIRKVLNHASFEAVRTEVNAGMAQEARQVLSAHRTAAARAWAASLTRAAQRGDHRPSRDLLLHEGVIAPTTQNAGGPSIIVNIGTIPVSSVVREELPVLDCRRLPEDAGDGSHA